MKIRDFSSSDCYFINGSNLGHKDAGRRSHCFLLEVTSVLILWNNQD